VDFKADIKILSSKEVSPTVSVSRTIFCKSIRDRTY
jgi:hypothetical protein